MQAYMGYGFDANDIPNTEWMNLIKTEPDDYDAFRSDCRDNFGTDDEKTLRANVSATAPAGATHVRTVITKNNAMSTM